MAEREDSSPRTRVLQASAEVPGRCEAKLSGIELDVRRVFGKGESLDAPNIDRLARVSPMWRWLIALPPEPA